MSVLTSAEFLRPSPSTLSFPVVDGSVMGGSSFARSTQIEGGRDDTGRRASSALDRTTPQGALARSLGSFLSRCANPACTSGWLHLWRSRSRPRFEEGWTCSTACTEDQLRTAIRREFEGRGSGEERHRHRVPLGLLMLERGWINSSQLRGALEAQRASGGGRLGQWLIRQQGASEQMVTRALGLQWSCPVLPLEFHDGAALTPVAPRLFLDAFGALPLRVAAGKLLYLGFEVRLDPVLALALERMNGLRVESGLVQSSLFRPAQERMLCKSFPRVQLLEATSEPVLVTALARALEGTRPVASRLVRVHECLWLRMWRRYLSGTLPDTDGVEDLICTIGDHTHDVKA